MSEETQNVQDVAKAPKGKKRKVGKKWIKWVVLAGVIGGGALYVRSASQKAVAAIYNNEAVEARDITVFHSFTGTVEPESEQTISASVQGVRVTAVNVKRGDHVKKGDIIATLDSKNVDRQIAQAEASLQQSKRAGELSVQQAQQSYGNLQSNIANDLDQSTQSAKAALDNATETYSNLVYNIQNNLDSQLQAAQNQVNSSFVNLVNAQNGYNDEVKLNNQQLSSLILNSQQAVESAYQNVLSAQQSVSQAQDAKEHAAQVAADKGLEYDSFSDDQRIDSAKMSVEAAWLSYRHATDSYKAAKINEESRLTSLYDSLLSAQDTYLQAVDSYNATVNSLQQQLVTLLRNVQVAQKNYDIAVNGNTQQLQSLATSIANAQNGADTTATELSIEGQKANLDDYVIKAEMDGEVTVLDIKEGDVLSTTNMLNLGRISQFDKMKIKVKIGEYDIQGAEEGSPVTVYIDALDKEYDGKISYISRVATVDSGVSYFESEVEFVPDNEVRSGMSGEVKLITTDVKNVLTIPNDAIQSNSDGTSYVQISSDGGKTMTQQPITTGATDGKYTEVTEGLAEGDTVYFTRNVQTLMEAIAEDEASIDAEVSEE